ncbi:MAG: hypothetical protein WD970_02950 [Patescibacteria group bacterium]
MKRKSIGNLIIFVLVLFCCFFAPGCSPVQAAEQPVQAEPKAPMPEVQKDPVPGFKITTSQLPDYVTEPERIEALIANIYVQADRIAQQGDRAGSEKLSRAGQLAEEALREYRNSLSPEEYQFYWARRNR